MSRRKLSWRDQKAKAKEKQKNAYFSINKYGDDKAKTKAIKARRSAVRANKIG